MNVTDLTERVMDLPQRDRVAIAQKVWESIEDEHVAISPGAEADTDALRRDKEMSTGEATERPHEDVMANAWRVIECE
jgi:hypothetical protein